MSREIYTSVYFIDIEKNYFTEISSAAQVHTHVGASGDAQERLNYFCHHMVMPEFTDEMLEFVDLSTLDKRFCKTRILSKKYRSNIFRQELLLWKKKTADSLQSSEQEMWMI